MLSTKAIVDVRDDGDCDDCADAEGGADEAEEGAVGVVEVLSFSYQCLAVPYRSVLTHSQAMV